MDKLFQDRYETCYNPDVLALIKEASSISTIREMILPLTQPNTTMDPKDRGKSVGEIIYAIASTHNIEGLLKRHNVYQLLSASNSTHISGLCGDIGLVLPPKVRKKGKNAIIKKILEKYDTNTRVQTKLDWFTAQSLILSYPFAGAKDLLPFTEFLGLLNKSIEEKDRDKTSQTVMFTCILFQTPASSYITNMLDIFDDDMWTYFEDMLLNSFLLECEMKNTSNDTANTVPTINQLLEERKKLSQKLARHEKQQNQLQSLLRTEMLERQTQEKELKTTIYALNLQLQQQLESAVLEIERLESELGRASEENGKLVAENEDLWALLKSSNNANIYAPLKGKTICVIGDPNKKDLYKSVVLKYGGGFEFYPSILETGLSRMAGPVGRSDVVMYLAIFTDHTIGNKLKSLIDVSRIKPLYASSLEYFENQLVNEVIPDLTKSQDKTNIIGG